MRSKGGRCCAWWLFRREFRAGALARCVSWVSGMGRSILFTSSLNQGRLSRREIRPVPPAAAQRLKQCSGIGEARRLRLDQRDMRLLIGLLGVEQRQIGAGAQLELAPRDGEAVGGRTLCGELRVERVG